MDALISVIDSELAEFRELCQSLSKVMENDKLDSIILRTDLLFYRFNLLKMIYFEREIPNYREKLLKYLEQEKLVQRNL